MQGGQHACHPKSADNQGAQADLLVCIDQNERILELVLFQNGMELIPRSADPLCVAAVHHIDDGLRVGVIAPPVWPDAGLAPQIPHLELDVFVGDSLHIETDCCTRSRRFFEKEPSL